MLHPLRESSLVLVVLQVMGLGWENQPGEGQWSQDELKGS